MSKYQRDQAQSQSPLSQVAGYDLQEVEVVLGQIDDVIQNISGGGDGIESIKTEVEMQKVLHANNTLIKEIVDLYVELQKLENTSVKERNQEKPNHQNQVFKTIVEKIRKLNEDLHLIFREYRNATPITEQKR